MSFDDEWSQLKSAAADRSSASQMQLNTLDGGGGGPIPEGDLAVSQDDLARIGDEAFKLYRRLDTDGDHAKASSYEAATSLKDDFAIGGALSTVTDKWNSQVDTLLAACAHISNHLDYSSNAHAGDEYYIATQFRYVDLNEGFDERTQG
ncbi:hypothetical protein KQY30_22815 [Streptomyces sp. GMY02]|uniref:hypothetical protein n=1 Tax=Streptomyces sp. GMY02 TaxID=1333528 RepID=UPI001C2C8E3D|nr:hypothetical protein [Streptomyces sp. GMY02]QXE36630.1 hypothetical protein KQY30_22815 [Streptomyces sp. GMY02]